VVTATSEVYLTPSAPRTWRSNLEQIAARLAPPQGDEVRGFRVPGAVALCAAQQRLANYARDLFGQDGRAWKAFAS
jgi:hypothetical protein